MKKLASLLLALAMLLVSAGCGAQTPAPGGESVDMNVYVLSGPTGIGALPLRRQAEDGAALHNTYHFTMTGANDEVVAAVSSGQADVACVATNLAAALYNKTGGGVKVLAVNTLGVPSSSWRNSPSPSKAAISTFTSSSPLTASAWACR